MNCTDTVAMTTRVHPIDYNLYSYRIEPIAFFFFLTSITKAIPQDTRFRVRFGSDQVHNISGPHQTPNQTPKQRAKPKPELNQTWGVVRCGLGLNPNPDQTAASLVEVVGKYGDTNEITS
jgi:hypothetical protein